MNITIARISLIFLMVTAVASCAGSNVIDQAVPQAAFGDVAQEPLPPPVEPDAQALSEVDAEAIAAPLQPGLSTGAPIDTGTFPNPGDEPQRSQNQFTDIERDALMAEMQALQQQQQAGGVSTAASRQRLLELQRLAATHSEDSLQQIEGQ